MGCKNTKNKNNKKVKSEKIEPVKRSTKIIKTIVSDKQISGVGHVKYKSQNYIVVAYISEIIELYDTTKYDLVGKYNKEIYSNKNIYTIKQFSNQKFLVSGSKLVSIFAFYENNDTFSQNKIPNFNIELIQTIDNPVKSFFIYFVSSFVFDKNLNKEFYKNEEYKEIISHDQLLIANSSQGIFIYTRNIDKEESNSNNNEEIEINKNNIDNYKEKWKKNPFIYKKTLSNIYNYDIIQVNFKLISGTIDNYVALYSIEPSEIITKFQVKTTKDYFKTMSMLTYDILCIGGLDTVSLISIKNFDIIFEFLLNPNYIVAEICILPDNNIMIGIGNKIDDVNQEILLWYKYNSTEKKEHNSLLMSSELLTKNISNLTMEGIGEKKLITIIENKKIQIRELSE